MTTRRRPGFLLGALIAAWPMTSPAGAQAQAPASSPAVSQAASPSPSARAALARCDERQAELSALDAAYCYDLIGSRGLASYATVSRILEERLARDPSNPKLRLSLAMLADRSRDASAADHYAAAAAAFASGGDRPDQVTALVALSSWHSRSGHLDAAIRALEEARSAAASVSETSLRVLLETQAAWIGYGQADYGAAQRALELVAPLTTSVAPGIRARWLGAHAAVAWALGAHEIARSAYSDQLAILEGDGDLAGAATALVNLALLSRGETKVAFARRAVELARRTGGRSTEAYALFYLSEATSGPDSLQLARAAHDAARASGDGSALALTARRLARTLLPVDPASAFRIIDASIARSRATADAEETVRQLIVRSIMRWMAGPRDRAIADSLEVLDAVERIRNLQPEDTVRARRFAQWRYAYYRLAWHLLQGTHARDGAVSREERELAFGVLERVRARLLLDRLDSAMAASHGRLAADHPLRLARQDVLRRIAGLNQRLMSRELGDADRSRTLADLQALELEEAAISARIATEDPTFAAARSPAPATTTELQAALGADEALVVLQVIDVPTDRPGVSYGGWVWVLTRDALRVHRIDDSSGLRARIDGFADLIARRDEAETEASARLYRDVFGHALDDLPPGIDRLVLVADETLPRLPFAALRATATEAPLALRYAITLAPSATTWLAWRRTPAPERPAAALILAAPAWPGAGQGGGTSASDRSAAVPTPRWLRSLPYAHLEGRWLLRALGRGTRLLSGASASEAHLRRETLSRYRLLHFATHAVVDAAHPERTAIVLAAGGPGDDGLLQVRDIVELPLDGQIVTISACESAGGPVVPGEGVMSLAHAFFRAGARAVAANLWPVQDLESAEVSRALADHLGRGLDLADAVALAQRERIAAGAPAAAWAGLVVMGDGSATVTDVTDAPGPTGPMWVGLCTLLLAAVALVTSRRHR